MEDHASVGLAPLGEVLIASGIESSHQFRHAGGGDLPQGVDQPGYPLSVEEAVRGVGVSELRELRELRQLREQNAG
jgi:hypothetical protein